MNKKFEYLREHEFLRETILTCLSGAQMCWINEIKSRDTATFDHVRILILVKNCMHVSFEEKKYICLFLNFFKIPDYWLECIYFFIFYIFPVLRCHTV